MSNALIRKDISVKKSPIHGYGVFADQFIEANDIIEECYFLPLMQGVADLKHVLFRVSDNENGLLLGYGSIYNHCDEPNAAYAVDRDRQVMVFKACRSIDVGDEIVVHYGENWFSSHGIIPKYSQSKAAMKSLTNLMLRFLLIVGFIIGSVYLGQHLFSLPS